MYQIYGVPNNRPDGKEVIADEIDTMSGAFLAADFCKMSLYRDVWIKRVNKNDATSQEGNDNGSKR